MSKRKKITPKKNINTNKDLEKKIIGLLLNQPKKLFNHKQIASATKQKTHQQLDAVLKTLVKLKAEKRITEEDHGKYKINQQNNYLVGQIDVTRNGTAYVIVDGHEQDILVSKNKTKNALNGDTVRVYVYPKKQQKGRLEGEVTEIIERHKSEFTGVFALSENQKYGFVKIESRQIHVDFYIPKNKFNQAQDGEKVLVKINDWPEGADSPFGEILEVLGDPKDSRVEMHSILLEYGLPNQFPEEVEQEAQQLDTSIKQEEIAKRRDMRKAPTFTIDPKDAKDFDDALSLQKLPNGNWELGVHIADVSHYVKPNSILDQEAYKRSTSVYLVDRVVPMLPEILSNNACSLRPNEEKYTFSGVFELDNDAQVINTWFGRTVIYSDKRYAYEDAQDIIEGAEGDFKDEILTLNQLAKKLRKRRLNSGAISFDKHEVKFELDEDNNPKSVYLKVMKDANHLIEEFMLLCNKKVSEFISLNKNKEPSGKTYVYRVHDYPDQEKLYDLKNYIKQFGYQINVDNRKKIAETLNQLLEEVKDKPEANMIETLTMRCMSKAKYTTQNIGHYGLAFDYYTHFTSPIRRYPDVIAHRLLQHYLDGGKVPTASKYEDQCEHASKRERLAIEAERESIKYMQVKFMEQYVGEEFYGYITGIQDYGMFVEVIETRCEGMIRLKNIAFDQFYLDQKSQSIIGKTTGMSLQLGDKVLIRVARADVAKKQLDFDLLG